MLIPEVEIASDFIESLQNTPEHKVLMQAIAAYKSLLSALEAHMDNQSGLHMPAELLPDLAQDILRTTACLTIFCQRYYANPAHQAKADLAATQN